MLALVRVKPLGLMLFDAKTRPKHIVPGDEAAKRLESLAHSTSGNRKLPGEHGEGTLVRWSVLLVLDQRARHCMHRARCAAD